MPVLKGLHARLITEQVKRVLKAKNYVYFDGNIPWNVNIIGVRASDRLADSFDDTILVLYRNKKGENEVFSTRITTDPSTYYLIDHPVNPSGTAILVPAQYRGVYKVDIHAKNNPSFAHEALCQRNGPVQVYRDNNRDHILDHDPDSVEQGWFGINIHQAKSGETRYVGSYSAGCQVFKNSTEFKKFLEIIKRSRDSLGNSFTYTLLKESDFED